MSAARSTRIRLRTPRRLMTTTFGNELAAAINGSPQPFATGEGDAQRQFKLAFVGKVVTAGPHSEANYTDERYWVRRQYVDAAATTAAPTFKDDTSDADLLTVTVTNLAEVKPGVSPGSGTHSLATSTIVYVFAEVDNGTATLPPLPHYVMVVGSALPFPRPIYSVLMPINSSGDLAFDRPRLA